MSFQVEFLITKEEVFENFATNKALQRGGSHHVEAKAESSEIRPNVCGAVRIVRQYRLWGQIYDLTGNY